MQSKRHLKNLLWVGVVVWISVMLLSLHYGWLNGFFFDTSLRHVQGVDFFPVPRSGANLALGKSPYDTFSSFYGPYATWFLYHPAAAVLFGLPLSLLPPWASYWTWTAISFGLMCGSTWLIAHHRQTSIRTPAVALLVLGSFPTYVMLHGGNLQALLVLSLTLIFIAIDRMHDSRRTRSSQVFLLTGLLLSLFTKPLALLMLPLLLLMRPTRKVALWALVTYGAVTLVCLSNSYVNPEPISWGQRSFLFTHPAVVKHGMNIYNNGFVVTPSMKDASVHWFSMIALSDFRYLNVNVFSLSRFLDTSLGIVTPTSLYRVPLILALEVVILVASMRDEREKMRAALLTVMAISLLVFLSYGLAWEYSYTGVLPIAGMLVMQERRGFVCQIVIASCVFVWAPSLFLLVHRSTFDAERTQALVLLDRVVPVAIIFCLLLTKASLLAFTQADGLLWSRRSLTEGQPSL